MGRPKKTERQPLLTGLPAEFLRALGSRVRDAREVMGLTQEAASARTTGSAWGYVSQPTWSRIENGDSQTDFVQLLAISEALGVPAVALAFPDSLAVSADAALIDHCIRSGNPAGAMLVLSRHMPKAPRK